ncbi:MAG: endonuclease III [Candidatus Coatesbacteria bacterium]|nr:endonuclease III [Candidatus Coatesbacteria bacterium]
MPERRPRRSPLDELILTILSQNTTDVNSFAAFKRLKARFPDWDLVLQADHEEIVDLIKVAGLGPTKARRIANVLAEIKKKDPTLEMGFLCTMSLSEGYRYLTAFPGIGTKTAACVLLFACDKAAFPVDTHVFRVSRRIGLDAESPTREKMQAFFEGIVPGKDRYNLHMNLIRLGRMICKARSPKCDRCFLSSFCSYYQDARQESRD